MNIFTSINRIAISSIALSLSILTCMANEMPLSGQGTESSPYCVATVNDWKQLATYMETNNATLTGCHVNLTSDIDWSGQEFIPLGTFDGHFNGLNHTVTGISYTTGSSYQGVFTTIDTSGKVENLTLQGNINSAYTYTAGFTGTLKGSIENCINQINVTSNKTNTAGFAAKATAGSTLTKCINKAEITSSMSNLSGIVADGDRDVTYTNCGNEGVIHSTGATTYTAGITAVSLPSTFNGCYNTGEIIIDKPTSATCVAGILGWANNIKNASPNTFTFTDCYNTEYINASGKVAGILAEVTLAAANAVTLDMNGCYNTGTIIASGSPSGNIGTAGISCFYTPESKFINCYNTGTIQAEKKPYCAGIAGHFKVIVSQTPTSTLFDGCYNTGDIKVTAGQGSGILAYCHKNVTVQNCYNTGTISGKSTLGGILSTMASDSKIYNCWNAGSVTTDAETAAGIVANNANHCLISGCFNAGNITSNSGKTAGGIAATCGSDLVDCINFGHIKGLLEVGGLIGAPRQANTTFTRCYNAGIVEAPDNACGALIGVSTENTGYWNESNTVTDAYYVTGFNTFTLPQAGKPVTMKELIKLELGNDWIKIADNCMPLPKVYEKNSAAMVNSAAIVPNGNESFDKIVSDFLLGCPQDITWTSSGTTVSIDGSIGKITSVDTPTDVTLTASSGDFSRIWHITVCPKVTTSIDNISNNQDIIIDRKYYNIVGQAVPEHSVVTGQLYLVKETYASGSVRTNKIIAR